MDNNTMNPYPLLLGQQGARRVYRQLKPGSPSDVAFGFYLVALNHCCNDDSRGRLGTKGDGLEAVYRYI